MSFDNELYQYLKFSCRRYIVGCDGRIFDRDFNELTCTEKDGELFVELSWINGKDLYSVGMLVIVTFIPMYLPDHLWLEIEPLPINEDPNDMSADNLRYRFRNELIPYERNPTFFYIPGFTRYVIDRYGIMLNAETGKEKGWHIVKRDLIRNSTGGYYATRVYNRSKQSSVLLRHRALCLTFKGIYKASDYDRIGNHKDGVPGNDDLDNLEWSNYKRNNKHAHESGLTGRRKMAVLERDLKTGDIKRYENTRQAAKAHGYKTTAAIRYRLRHAQDVLFHDYLQFKWDDGSDWAEVVIEGAEPVRFVVGDTMAARNVFTGKIVTFDSFEEGMAKTGVDKQTIMIHVRDRQIVPFRGLNFGYYLDDMEWPEHHPLNLEVYKAYPVCPPDPVIVIDLNDNTETAYLSRNEVAEALGISRSYATALVVNNWTYKDRYQFRYHLLRDNIKVPSDWKV